MCLNQLHLLLGFIGITALMMAVNYYRKSRTERLLRDTLQSHRNKRQSDIGTKRIPNPFDLPFYLAQLLGIAFVAPPQLKKYHLIGKKYS